MFLEKSNKLAIIDIDGTNIDYNQFVGRVKYYSNVIFKDIPRDKKVLIVAENRVEWVFSFYAIWDRVSAVVCVDAMSNLDELVYYINDCGAYSIIATKQTIDNVKKAIEICGVDLKVYNIDEISKDIIDDDRILNHPEGDQLCVMVYTSGTTGSPKGVMLTYNNILGELDAIKSFDIVHEDEQTLAILPFHHILPLMATCIYFYYYKVKGSVVFVEALSSQVILKKLKDNRVTMIISVPRLFKLFYKSIKEKIDSSFISSIMYKIMSLTKNKVLARKIFKKVHDIFGGKLRTIIVGGAKSEIEIIEFFENLGFNYCEGYGLSETAPVVAGSVGQNYKIGTVGKIVPNCDAKLVDGELWVKGPMVMKGYYNKPEKTKEVITPDGWFKTGDLATIDKDGYITIIGRANAMIVLSNGKNIDPEKIENKIINSSNNMIEEIGVFSRNDKLTALVVPNKNVNNITAYVKDVIQMYNSKAHNYEKILDFKIINEELPKTRVGKLRRFMLKDLYEKDVVKKIQTSEPTIREYQILKEYIKKNKEIDISPDDNFEIDLAMDSLDQVEMISYINNSFNIKITEEIILSNPTPRALSQYIHENSSEFKDTSISIEDIIKNAPYKKLEGSRVTHFASNISSFAMKLYFNIKINGKEKIQNKPTIFIANHESFIDGPVLNMLFDSKIRDNTYYFALGKYFSKGLLKYLADNSNILKVDIEKNIKQSVEQTSNVLKQGKNLFIFPEGSRTMDGNLNEFKKLFAIFAKELDIEIQCIGIKGAFEAYSRHDKMPKFRSKIQVDVLDRISPTNLTVDEIIEKSFDVFKKYKGEK